MHLCVELYMTYLACYQDDDNNCISESTIKKLFANSYETKSLLTAPIHVMELTSSIPNELRPESRGHTPYTPTNEPAIGLTNYFKISVSQMK